MTTKQNNDKSVFKNCVRNDIQDALFDLDEVADIMEYKIYSKNKCIRIKLNDNDPFYISYKNYSIDDIINHDTKWKKKIVNKLQKEVTKPSYRHIYIITTNDGYTLDDINLNGSNVCKKTTLNEIQAFSCYFTKNEMKLLIEANPGIVRYEKDEHTFIPDPDIIDSNEPIDALRTDGDRSKSIQIAPFLKRIGADKSSRKVGSGEPDFKIQKENIYVFILDTGISNHDNLNINKKLCKNFTKDNDYNDEIGHGTHVAGIIGAKGLNGVYGVSPGIQLIAYKVLDSRGRGQKSDLMAGLDDILKFKKNLNNKSQVIVNLSLSGSGNENEDKLIEIMINNNITVVIAAGNQGMSVESISPARSKGITVGSYNSQTNVFSKSSNFGIEVDMAAPGVGIKSTWINNSYEIKNGTSMAAPVVTGAIVNMVALSMKNEKILTPYKIKARLQADAINAYKESNNPILDDTNKDNIFKYSVYIGNDQLY